MNEDKKDITNQFLEAQIKTLNYLEKFGIIIFISLIIFIIIALFRFILNYW